MARSNSICGDGEVFGPYLIFERIGVGGMATVHRAKERGIEGFERLVALKRLLPHLAEDEKFVRSFVREAKLASLLQHPNVVQLYELGRVGHVYFISMELIEGRDLRQVLRQARKATGAPPIPLVVEILSQLCDALDYAHTRSDEQGQPLGLVHRDVSPSNVIVAESGHVKVIDFGIAKATSIHLRTQSGRVKGKMAYMSPEAIKGIDLDGRSDIFSTGVLAHELLTARPLFATKNDYQTLMRVQKATVAPPSTFNQDCPPELDAIVLKALSRDRDHRWQSAAAMRESLNQLRRAYQMNTSYSDIAQWMEWAFALEGQPSAELHPTTTTPVRVPLPHPLSDRSGRRYLHTPATRPLQIPIGGVALPVAEDDEEVIEIAWGGRSNHDAIPVLLDEVPDVSDKIALPAVELSVGASSSTTLVGQAPPPPMRARSSAGLPIWARGSRVFLEDDDPLEFDRVPIPSVRERSRSTMTGPITITPTHSTVTGNYSEVPFDEDDGPSVRLPVIKFRESASRPVRAATEIGASIVERHQRHPLRRVVVVAGAAAAIGVAALFLLRGHGEDAAAQAVARADEVALSITVEPGDAVISIEGHGVHQGSPVRVDLEPGEYRVEIQRDGFKTWVSTIELKDHENQAMRIALERGGSASASVAIGAIPADTQVLIDGAAIAEATPTVVELEPGDHRIAIASHSGVLWQHDFTAAADTRYEFHPVLDPRQLRHSSRRAGVQEAMAAPVMITSPTLSHAGAGQAESAAMETAREARATRGVGAPATELASLLTDSEPPPATTPRGPVLVPPSAVTKLSGAVPVVQKRRGTTSMERVSAKLCIDERGEVTRVDILTPVTKQIATTLRESLHGWRYRPYQDGGVAVAACFAVGFKSE